MSKRKNEFEFENQAKCAALSAVDLSDSDGSDNDDDRGQLLDHTVMKEDDIEGEEEVTSGLESENRMTAFNMREELEEGHFDVDGNFFWNKDKEIRDNWLDNIDWEKIPKSTEESGTNEIKTLGDSSDSDDEISDHFDETETYAKILKFMTVDESVSMTLQRLGKCTKKLSTLERLKLKKSGVNVLDKSQEVIQLTELCNKILKYRGNMDIYQVTYEQINNKINNTKNRPSTSKTTGLDMYSDVFDTEEQKQLKRNNSGDIAEPKTAGTHQNDSMTVTVLWEFKWNRKNSKDVSNGVEEKHANQDEDKIYGPYDSTQMQEWVYQGFFKEGAYVRKIGDNTNNFYNINRIDFELFT